MFKCKHVSNIFACVESDKIKMKGKSMRKEKTGDVDESLRLEDILELGGSQSDLELLDGVDEDGDLEVQDDSVGEQPIKQSELEVFIAKLGFSKPTVVKRDNDSQHDKKPADEKPLKSVKTKKDRSNDSSLSQVSSCKNSNTNGASAKLHSSIPGASLQTIQEWIQAYRPRKYLLLKPGCKWFDYRFHSDGIPFTQPSEDIVQVLEQFAVSLMKDECDVYRKQQEAGKKSSAAWMKTVLSSGTQADKVAALVVLVQESPVHNLSSLDSLLAFAKKKSRRESLQILDTLKELFISDLLPETNKLRAFSQNPLNHLIELSSGNRDMHDKRLVMWYFESELKKKYSNFLSVLETLSHDTVEAVRKKCSSVVFDLLCSRPEQEKKLLSMLINKLGDPNYKVAANTAHLLSRLVAVHPVMKTVIVCELERLLYRANISSKAQYYGICFLNQLLLSNDDQQLASKLLAIYFSFFKVYVKKGEVESKMLSALLTGVNRAYPYAKADRENLATHVDTLYKVVHISPLSASIQALMLIYQVIDVADNSSDRYYTALYRKLLDHNLQTSNKLAMFLNLLFKSIKSDVVEKRAQAFVKRLLQVCKLFSPPFICASLYMISELAKCRPKLLNLAKLQSQLVLPKQLEVDDDYEHFSDVCDEDEGEEKKVSEKLPVSESSWIHRKNVVSHKSGVYDANLRNPLYCNADADCMWELTGFAQHYHPSVALFARTILSGQSITYTGDPLDDFTLVRFLERFVYRNPKKVSEKTPSVMSAGSRHSKTHLSDVRCIPVNSDVYLQRDSKNIPADEMFFYQYFRHQAETKQKNKVDDMDSDVDDVSDTEFDDFLDKFEHGIADTDKDVDFAGGLGQKQTGGKSKRNQKVSEESDSESGDDDDDDDDEERLSDEEVEFDDFNMDSPGDSSCEGGQTEAFDEENVQFDDSEDNDDEVQLKPKRKKHRSAADVDDALFAAADDFSHLIEEDSEMSSMSGTKAVSRKDHAGFKQLKWEMDRDVQTGGKWKKPTFRKKNVSKQSKQRSKVKQSHKLPSLKRRH